MLGPLFLVTIAYCLLFSTDSSSQTECGSPQDPLQGALLSAFPSTAHLTQPGAITFTFSQINLNMFVLMNTMQIGSIHY